MPPFHFNSFSWIPFHFHFLDVVYFQFQLLRLIPAARAQGLLQAVGGALLSQTWFHVVFVPQNRWPFNYWCHEIFIRPLEKPDSGPQCTTHNHPQLGTMAPFWCHSGYGCSMPFHNGKWMVAGELYHALSSLDESSKILPLGCQGKMREHHKRRVIREFISMGLGNYQHGLFVVGCSQGVSVPTPCPASPQNTEIFLLPPWQEREGALEWSWRSPNAC